MSMKSCGANCVYYSLKESMYVGNYEQSLTACYICF